MWSILTPSNKGMGRSSGQERIPQERVTGGLGDGGKLKLGQVSGGLEICLKGALAECASRRSQQREGPLGNVPEDPEADDQRKDHPPAGRAGMESDG